MSAARAGAWLLGLGLVALAGLNLRLAGAVRALSSDVAHLRLELTEREPAPAAAPSHDGPAVNRGGGDLDYDRIAIGVARRLDQGRALERAASTDDSAAAAGPPRDDESAATAASVMAPYLRRMDLTAGAWNELGRRLAAVPEARRDGVQREVFGAITRGELVPPPGIRFADALMAPPPAD
jgi:hypothetical protein